MTATGTAAGGGSRIAQVRAVLDRVSDPELDESVVSLGFVSSLAVDDAGQVAVGFRLPTYWCSANFAWIMAEDMRDAVLALPWVRGASVILDEHMFADRINAAVNAPAGDERRSFAAAFGAEADGASLAAVRDTFARKAFGGRQLVLLEALLAEGRDPAAILSLRMADLDALPRTAALDRYRDRRGVPGPFSVADPAFVSEHGAPIPSDRLHAHLSTLRGIAVNMEFNGALCRGMLAARYDEADTVPAAHRPAPELIDFIRDARRAA